MLFLILRLPGVFKKSLGLGVLQSPPEYRIPKEFRNPKSDVLPPIRPALPVADAFASFLGVPGAG